MGEGLFDGEAQHGMLQAEIKTLAYEEKLLASLKESIEQRRLRIEEIKKNKNSAL